MCEKWTENEGQKKLESWQFCAESTHIHQKSLIWSEFFITANTHVWATLFFLSFGPKIVGVGLYTRQLLWEGVKGLEGVMYGMNWKPSVNKDFNLLLITAFGRSDGSLRSHLFGSCVHNNLCNILTAHCYSTYIIQPAVVVLHLSMYYHMGSKLSDLISFPVVAHWKPVYW